MVWTVRLQYAIDTVDDYSLETQLTDTIAEVIVVDQFRIAEHPRGDAQVMMKLLLVFGYLEFKLISGNGTGERVVIRFRQKIHRSCFRQAAEACQYLRRIGFKLVERAAGNGKRYFDLRILADQFQKQRICGKIALSGYALYDLLIEFVVEACLIVSYVKESERAQSFWLMYLKIQNEILRFFLADN